MYSIEINNHYVKEVRYNNEILQNDINLRISIKGNIALPEKIKLKDHVSVEFTANISDDNKRFSLYIVTETSMLVTTDSSCNALSIKNECISIAIKELSKTIASVTKDFGISPINLPYQNELLETEE